MAKGQTKQKRKHLREAADARRQRTRFLILLLVSLGVVIVLWLLYSLLMPADNVLATSNMIYLIVIVIAVALGEIGVKYSKWNTEYNKIKNRYGLDDESVKEQMKKDRTGN